MTRVNTFWRLEGSDENTIWIEEVADSRSFSEKFRVGKDVKSTVGFRVGLEDGTHGFGGTTWYSRFFNDNFGGTSNISNAARGELDVAVKMKCLLT